jgi:multidrug resistance efflux pump
MNAALLRLVRVLITLVAVAAAVVLGVFFWRFYMLSPWTRDGRVRVEVVGIAPEVAGRVTELLVSDNQLVHKGDLLFVVDPETYRLNVAQAEAVVENRRQDLQLRQAQAERRARLNEMAVSAEEKQQYAINATISAASLRQAEVAADLARLDLKRTEVRAPVNGWVTNLSLRIGDYATVGRNAVTIVDSDSFWVSGYFEETKLPRIHLGAPATIKLIGEDRPIRGHVDSFARGITDPNAAAGGEGLANVNPNFTWVRLAQRIPVRINLDEVPEGVRLAAGLTCTVTIEESAPAQAGTGSRSEDGESRAQAAPGLPPPRPGGTGSP